MTRDDRKRKRDEEVRDLPELDSDSNDGNETVPAKSKSDKPKSKDTQKNGDSKNKNKKQKKKEGDVAAENGEVAMPSRREKKLEKRKSKPEGKADGAEAVAEKDGGATKDETTTVEKSAEVTKKPARFIVFMGNLPYSATVASLTTHLATVKPTSIRLPTAKGSVKPKGFAFVELPDASRMKTCLKLFHHSMYEGRKINVELTAGGGGKSDERTEKLKHKNDKLNEERKRNFEKEMKEKRDKLGTSGEKKEEEEGGVHPSRRNMVKT